MTSGEIVHGLTPTDRNPPGRQAPRRLTSSDYRRLLEGAGVLILIMNIGWVMLVSEAIGGNGTNTILLFAAVGGAYFIASLVGRYHSWLVPFLILLAALYLAYANWTAFRMGPYDGPLGYSNADGAFFLIACGSALQVVVRSKSWVIKGVATAGALVCGYVPLVNDTRSAAALTVGVLAAATVRGQQHARKVVVLAVSLVGACVGAVLYLALTYGNAPTIPAGLEQTLSFRRILLWSDAIRIFLEHPWVGVGPGNFPLTSPTALRFPDTMWPHNELLHMASETGLPGLLLLLALIAFGFARLWVARADNGTCIAAATFAAVLVQANIDYVLHYPEVAVAIAIVVASGAQAVRLQS